jgi:hypothetical protein
MALNASTPAPISVDESLNDADSSYGGEGDAVSETTSLYSAITNHVYENGRRYHSYRAGSYWYHSPLAICNPLLRYLYMSL